MERRVRVRFAPSPTGGLHLGGVRTVLYNYLFARANGGDFVLRIEDTDQTRFVKGAEEYILECLQWCGLMPDESPVVGGPFAPYRQRERKEIYREYAMPLVGQGHAYYAFDTTDELEEMRRALKTDEHSSVQYDHNTRKRMRNSLTLSADEVNDLLNNNTPHVIRIKVPENETIICNDMIRGSIMFDSNLVDDKVLLKADGMPTYHLAVVVDDYLMKISHAFRGEEWLPSAPVHMLLWQYLGWIADMPQWAHLPLILKPDGNGKLSKRDGDRLGFPVFAMNWYDPAKDETTKGFRELGFMPQAFVNMLAMLGWNSGKEQEIFSLSELVKEFSIERVHKGGAKFDYEKAKWFNNQYIQQTDNHILASLVMPYMVEQGFNPTQEYLVKVIALVKDRCTLLPDFWTQSSFFFAAPEVVDESLIKDNKWNENKQLFFEAWMPKLNELGDWTDAEIEASAIELLPTYSLKKGDIMLPLRIMLVGGKFGPGVYHIAEMIGKEDTIARIKKVIG